MSDDGGTDASSAPGSAPERASDDAGSPAPRRSRRIGLWVLVGLLVLVLAVGGYFAVRTKLALSAIPRDTALMPNETGRPKLPDGPLTFLLMGSDTRDPNQLGNSDTLMIAYVPKDRKHIYLVSIPRDVWVAIHGRGYAKINDAFLKGGAPLTVLTVEDFLGVEIQHVGVIDFEGFIQLTDVLDGVDVINPQAFDTETEPDYYFPEGLIHIKGAQALAFVRERKHLENGDLDRTRNQRLVVRAIISKALQAGTLTNPGKMTALIDQASKCMRVDAGLDDNTIVAMASSLKVTSSADIRTLMLPIAGTDQWTSDGQVTDTYDRQGVIDLSLAMRTDTMDAYYDKHKDDPPVTGNVPDGYVPPEGRPKQRPTPWLPPGQSASPTPSPSPSR